MKSKVFTVYDSKLEAYMSPFLMQTKGQALRAFSDSVNSAESKNGFYHHPEDFTLFEIAEYDDATGNYTMHEAKIALGVATEFKKQLEMTDVRQMSLKSVQ